MKHEKSVFQRGDIVIFRPIHCRKKNYSCKSLLIGIVQNLSPCSIVNRDLVFHSLFLTVHVIGKLCSRQKYPDHILPTRQISNKGNCLPGPLKHFRREIMCERVQEAKIEIDGNMDGSEIICSQVHCLDDIVIASRQFVVNESSFARRQMNILEADVMRPAAFYKKIIRMLDFIEAKNDATMIIMKKESLESWKQNAKKLKTIRLSSASVNIQRIFRGFFVRKLLSRTHNRFKGYYVPQSMVCSVQCYKIRDGIYLSTQAKANEYFSLLSQSMNIMASLFLVNAREGMSAAIVRWKQTIEQQGVELKRMSEEEIFSII